ncbi:hypothetical protein ACFL5E_01175 [Candidatus Omnitrophota bacterium]
MPDDVRQCAINCLKRAISVEDQASVIVLQQTVQEKDTTAETRLLAAQNLSLEDREPLVEDLKELAINARDSETKKSFREMVIELAGTGHIESIRALREIFDANDNKNTDFDENNKYNNFREDTDRKTGLLVDMANFLTADDGPKGEARKELLEVLAGIFLGMTKESNENYLYRLDWGREVDYRFGPKEYLKKYFKVVAEEDSELSPRAAQLLMKAFFSYVCEKLPNFKKWEHYLEDTDVAYELYKYIKPHLDSTNLISITGQNVAILMMFFILTKNGGAGVLSTNELIPVYKRDEYVIGDYRRNLEDVTEELVKEYLSHPSLVKVRYELLAGRYDELSRKLREGIIDEEDVVAAFLWNNQNAITSQGADLVLQHVGQRGVIDMNALMSKISYRHCWRGDIAGVLRDLLGFRLTREKIEQILLAHGFRTYEHEGGNLIIPIAHETYFSAYRGTGEQDNPLGEYLTHSLSTAITKYGFRKGERTGASGATAFHEFDLAALMIAGQDIRIKDNNVGLAFHRGRTGDSLPEYSRKRTESLYGNTVAGHFDEIMQWQYKEGNANQLIYKVMKLIEEGRLSKKGLERAISAMKFHLNIIEHHCGFKEEYFNVVFGCLNDKFFASLEAEYQPLRNNRPCLVRLLNDAMKKVPSHPWISQGNTLLDYLDLRYDYIFTKKAEEWSYYEYDISSFEPGHLGEGWEAVEEKPKESPAAQAQDRRVPAQTLFSVKENTIEKIVREKLPQIVRDKFNGCRVINVGSTGRGTNIGKTDFDFVLLLKRDSDISTFKNPNNSSVKAVWDSLSKALDLTGCSVINQRGGRQKENAGTLYTFTVKDSSGEKFNLQITVGKERVVYADHYEEQMLEIESKGASRAKVTGDIKLMRKLVMEVLGCYKEHHGGMGSIGWDQIIMQSAGSSDKGRNLTGVGSFHKAMHWIYEMGFDRTSKRIVPFSEVEKTNAIYDPERAENLLSRLNPYSWKRLFNAARKYVESGRDSITADELTGLSYKMEDALRVSTGKNYIVEVRDGRRAGKFIGQLSREAGFREDDVEIVGKEGRDFRYFILFNTKRPSDIKGRLASKGLNIVSEFYAPDSPAPPFAPGDAGKGFLESITGISILPVPALWVALKALGLEIPLVLHIGMIGIMAALIGIVAKNIVDRIRILCAPSPMLATAQDPDQRPPYASILGERYKDTAESWEWAYNVPFGFLIARLLLRTVEGGKEAAESLDHSRGGSGLNMLIWSTVFAGALLALGAASAPIAAVLVTGLIWTLVSGKFFAKLHHPEIKLEEFIKTRTYKKILNFGFISSALISSLLFLAAFLAARVNATEKPGIYGILGYTSVTSFFVFYIGAGIHSIYNKIITKIYSTSPEEIEYDPEYAAEPDTAPQPRKETLEPATFKEEPFRVTQRKGLVIKDFKPEVLRDIKNEEELCQSFIDIAISKLLSDGVEKLVLAFDTSLAEGQGVNPITLMERLEELKEDDRYKVLLKDLVIIKAPANKLEGKLAEYMDKENTPVFVFAHNANKRALRRVEPKANTVYIKEEGAGGLSFPREAYYPLLEVVVISLAYYIDKSSLEHVEKHLKAVNIEDIDPTDESSLLVFTLLPEATPIDLQAHMKKYRRLKEFLKAA